MVTAWKTTNIILLSNSFSYTFLWWPVQPESSRTGSVSDCKSLTLSVTQWSDIIPRPSRTHSNLLLLLLCRKYKWGLYTDMNILYIKMWTWRECKQCMRKKNWDTVICVMMCKKSKANLQQTITIRHIKCWNWEMSLFFFLIISFRIWLQENLLGREHCYHTVDSVFWSWGYQLFSAPQQFQISLAEFDASQCATHFKQKCRKTV